MPEDARSVLADRASPAPVRERERVFEGAVWDVVRDRFSFGGGELVREYQKHPGAVAILAQDEQERILLIQQYRHPIGMRDWELPAGLLDVAGERPLDAARRELAEEADLRARDWAPLCEFFSSPGGSSERVTVFRARGLSPSPRRFARSAEESDMDTRWVALDDVVAAVLDGRLRNAILAISVLNAHARH